MVDVNSTDSVVNFVASVEMDDETFGLELAVEDSVFDPVVDAVVAVLVSDCVEKIVVVVGA